MFIIYGIVDILYTSFVENNAVPYGCATIYNNIINIDAWATYWKHFSVKNLQKCRLLVMHKSSKHPGYMQTHQCFNVKQSTNGEKWKKQHFLKIRRSPTIIMAWAEKCTAKVQISKCIMLLEGCFITRSQTVNVHNIASTPGYIHTDTQDKSIVLSQYIQCVIWNAAVFHELLDT